MRHDWGLRIVLEGDFEIDMGVDTANRGIGIADWFVGTNQVADTLDLADKIADRKDEIQGQMGTVGEDNRQKMRKGFPRAHGASDADIDSPKGGKIDLPNDLPHTSKYNQCINILEIFTPPAAEIFVIFF